MITKRTKLLITFENIIKSDKILEMFEKKEYASKTTQNYTKRELDNRLIKDLKKIAKKTKKTW